MVAASPATADSPATMAGSLPIGFASSFIAGAIKISGMDRKSDASSRKMLQARGDGSPQDRPAMIVSSAI